MKSIAFLLATLSAFGGGGDEKAKNKLPVRVKQTVAVRGLDVTVGELCDLPTDAPAALAIANVAFGKAPAIGHSRTVSRGEIVQRLAGAGIDLTTLEFAGADEVVVQPVFVEVPAQDLLDAATNALQAHLAVQAADIEYELPRQVRHVQAPPGRRSQEVRARVRGPQVGSNTAVVDVDVLVDGESFRKVPLQFRLIRFQQVLKTTGALREGTPLGPESLEIVREPVDQAPGLFLDRFEQVDGMLASRNLPAGSRITLIDIEPPALVRRGDIVTVVLTKGRVKVTAKAQALNDAPLGGRVTLRSTTSTATMTGQVQAPGLVVIPQ